MPLGVDIPVKEVQRYMGYHGIADIAPEMQVLIDKAIDRLSTQSHPRIVSKEYLIDVSEKSVVIHTENEDLTLESESLARNLKGCSGAILLAATIGPSCDMLVRRASVTSAAEASVYQAAGAAAIEAYCDLINEKIKNEYESKGLFARPRFSPGYGDLSLSHQKDWFRLLDITKNTGIELTDSLLMVPTKSVTAVIGLSPNKLPCVKQGCESCTMSATCAFSRKE